MDSNHRVPVVKDFWYKTEEEPDTILYQVLLGLTVPLQVESGGYTDTHDVWKKLMERTSPDEVHSRALCTFSEHITRRATVR